MPWSELKFRSVVEECLAMKESTLALLKTLGLVTTRIIIETQTKWFAGPFGPWLLLEDAQQKLTNLIDAVHELRLASRQLEYQHSKSSPITTVHVLLICYIALHMIEPSAALQYADQWRNLFDVLTDLGNESIGITSTNRNSGVAAATAEPSPSPVPYTIQPAQFIGVGFEESQQVVERCLKMVQRHDTHVLSRRPDIPFSQSMSAPELRSAYDDWLTLFTDEDSIIQDSFVKMLARIYNPPGLLVHHDGPKFQFFRLEKLGLARGSENDSDNGSSHTVMGFHML
ncbi:hypothetical protein BC835DRAFT_682710 [Cytidiella melzeri]|nr:hypothetical protein BC835DRAFT_682710 [Cytidiella melzeri]